MTPRVLLAVALLMLGVLAVATGMVRPPFRDEAWFANPAVSLLTHGHTGSTVLQSDSWLPNLVQPTKLTRIETRTYWIMPAHTYLQAAWYWVTGIGLIQMRLLSALFGVIGLVALYIYTARLFGSTRVAAVAVLLTAIDHRWVTMAGHGRMDTIAATFGLIGLAWYMTRRESQLPLAIAGATGAAALGALTHPVAVVSSAALAILIWRLDRTRVGLKEIGAGAGVVIAAFALFAWYASVDLEAFRDQLESNSGGRFSHLLQPGEAARGFFGLFFGTFAFGGGVGTVGLLIPIGIVVGLAGALLAGRPSDRAATRIVGLQIVAVVVYLTFLDNQKLHFYLVHVTPLCMVAISGFAVYIFERGSRTARGVVWLGLAGLAAVQLAPTAMRFVMRANIAVYMPAIEAARGEGGPDGRFVGSSESAFALGFDRVRDDRRLRAARLEPDVIVIISREDRSYLDWLPADEQREISRELSRRPEVFSNQDYSVFGRRTSPASPP
jgi:4-amino-4-deoxy-L-arabinose transferase-like glycosyltransferase